MTAVVVGICSHLMSRTAIGWVFVLVCFTESVVFYALGKSSKIDEEAHMVKEVGLQ